MSSKIEQLIDEIEAFIDDCKFQPLSSTKIIVNKEEMDELLRELRSVSDEPICRFEFAYAITCHKAQGSEFDFVIVFDESWAFNEEKNRWLYTAITRAREKLLIVR